MKDADVVAKWTREAAEQGMTEAQIRYVLAELAYYAGRRDERTGIEVSGVDGVWQSSSSPPFTSPPTSPRIPAAHGMSRG
jgi:TPR repeat protein